jgi:hypothetical protein
MKLNTENNNCFIYETEELLIELLGGVRVDTLDRMRVTIKVTVFNRKHKEYMNNEELAGLSVRHNLDLYNDTQTEKFVRTVAERLEVGTIAIKRAIADITSQLEVYRLTMLDKQNDKPVKQLTAQERETAMQFLESNDLLERTNEMIGKSGVIGEEVNRLLMYLIFTSRKREQPLSFSAGCTFFLLHRVYFHLIITRRYIKRGVFAAGVSRRGPCGLNN